MTHVERRTEGIGLGGLQVRPGEIALVTDGTILVSVVSLGVAVCLWCPSRQIAVMAQFVEPSTRERERATARYGNVAIPKALDMIREVAPCEKLEAQLFGGAHHSVEPGASAANVRMARVILERRGIPIVSEDVGGCKGRKIAFDSSNGHVAVVKVHRLRAGDWNP